MTQEEFSKIVASERILELKRMHEALDKLQGAGDNDGAGWDAALELVSQYLEIRRITLTQRYFPELIDAALGKTATVKHTSGYFSSLEGAVEEAQALRNRVLTHNVEQLL